MANRDNDFDDRLGDTGRTAGGKASEAADAALRRHNEPATTGDVVGESVGGLSGAATGAALGSLGGPIGTIIGGIAGAVGGWWSGRAISEAASSFTDDDDEYYRNQFESSRGSVTGSTSSTSSTSGSASDSKRSKKVVEIRDNTTSAGTSADDFDYTRARPAYQLGHLASRNPDYRGRDFDAVEPDLQRGWSSETHGDWSNVRDYARNGYDRGAEQRLTLSEEELAIGKRQVQSGEVELHKTVETEHVRQTVPVTREEVTVERRPLSANAATDVSIGEDEIRIPVMEEELVVDKRVVPKEEIVVRKQAVTEDRVVEEDVRRERVDYDENNLSAGAGGTTGRSGAADRATSSGLGDRIADKLDDVKDRFDGNPRSKPGPDSTDRAI